MAACADCLVVEDIMKKINKNFEMHDFENIQDRCNRETLNASLYQCYAELMELSAPRKRMRCDRGPRISFARETQVVLIPCRTDYMKAGLKSELWYQTSDFADMQREMLIELNEYMRKHNIVHATESTYLEMITSISDDEEEVENVCSDSEIISESL